MSDDNRPIEVGERVKITGIVPSTKIGTIGTVTAIDRCDGIPYKVMDSKGVTWWCSEVERIPRPAEAQAMVRIRVVYAHPDDVEAVFDHDAIYENGTAAKVTSDRREPRGMFRINWQNGDSKRFPVPMKAPSAPVLVDPLDVEYDGVRLRDLMTARQIADQCGDVSKFTPAQHAAVSAHWSAELRAKVTESSKPKLTVLCDSGEADE